MSIETIASTPSTAIDVSIVIATYNRSRLLAATLRSVVATHLGDPAIGVEVLVVDNNSHDDTRATVEPFVAEAPVAVRYLFEGRQGVAYARNTGVQAARGRIVAFLDDDVQVPADWLKTIVDAMTAHPDVAFVGGKVLPQWECPPPRWLTHDHWSPLGLIDHGDRPFRVHSGRPYCLVSGNLAVRRAVFDEVGLFDPAFQRIKDGIGSTEDHEFEMRVWAAGHEGLYLPTLVATSVVPATRMTKSYHRRWHRGHGAFSAMMWPYATPEESAVLFGLPAYFYRRLLTEAADIVRAKVRRDEGAAFLSETVLWHASTYVRKVRELHVRDRRHPLAEFGAFCFHLVRKKLSPGVGS